jgi:hypothetical protein
MPNEAPLGGMGFNHLKSWTAGQPVRSEDIMAAMYAVHYGAHIKELNIEPPLPRRREAIEHTRRMNGS